MFANLKHGSTKNSVVLKSRYKIQYIYSDSNILTASDCNLQTALHICNLAAQGKLLAITPKYIYHTDNGTLKNVRIPRNLFLIPVLCRPTFYTIHINTEKRDKKPRGEKQKEK